MSSTLGVLLKSLKPDLRVDLCEVTPEPAREASNGWHNAGTGHAGICELSYTPHPEEDGSVNVAKAISIFEEFEYSLQFWAYGARKGILKSSRDYINPVPHLSLVHTSEQVPFLKARYEGLKRHHFFAPMEFSTGRDTIRSWAPLLMDGRIEDQPVAATRMMDGTDVNFGAIAANFCRWLDEQPGCATRFSHRVVDLERSGKGWKVSMVDETTDSLKVIEAAFVFIGAGGGSLPLLQKSGIPEAKGYGAFPIGGQWMITDNPEVVEKHTAKVYGQALGAAPTMAAPHLDTRIIDGRKYLLFGPYAAWTGKFLHEGGNHFDLPLSFRRDNLLSLLQVGALNLDLVRYLIQQGLQSKESRMEELQNFYPDAEEEDWKVIDAGIRVQAIKKVPGEKPGIVHFGTEVLTSSDRTISALLGASPGASTSVHLMLECVKRCFPDLLASPEGRERMTEMIPHWDRELASADARDFFEEIHASAQADLQLA